MALYVMHIYVETRGLDLTDAFMLPRFPVIIDGRAAFASMY